VSIIGPREQCEETAVNGINPKHDQIAMMLFSERMSEADQTAMMLALQKEMAEMKKAHEKATRKNEEEIRNLREENREMKKLVDGGRPLSRPTKLAGPSSQLPTPRPRGSRGTRTSPWRWMVSPTPINTTTYIIISNIKKMLLNQRKCY